MDHCKGYCTMIFIDSYKLSNSNTIDLLIQNVTQLSEFIQNNCTKHSVNETFMLMPIIRSHVRTSLKRK